LEVKEAYTLEQMIKANLTTQSNGQPLSSGGMIYVNAANGQAIKIIKAIKVAVPTRYLDKKMQLYKGDETDSCINWNNPVTLTDNPMLSKIDEGALLFKNNCGSCHKVDVDFKGPALAHVIYRKGKDWAYNYEHGIPASTAPVSVPIYTEGSFNNYYETDTSKKVPLLDSLAQMSFVYNTGFYYPICLKEHFAIEDTKFPHLNNTALDAIYRYIQNETERLQVPYPNNNFTTCLDSCENYLAAINKLLDKRKALQKESVPQKIKNFRPPPDYVPSTTPVYPDNSVEAEASKSLYYQFSISVVGWYNIDALLNSFDNKTETELRVRIAGRYKANVSVNLVVPVINTFLEGGKLTADGDYGFYTKDGRIPLPLNAKAYILVMGETSGRIVFAVKEFIIAEKQSIEINPQPSTIENFNAAVNAIGNANIQIKSVETQAGKDLKENERQLKEAEKLKPKNCGCDCNLLK
jgi:cytochrome c2